MNGGSYLIFVWTPNGWELEEREGEPPEAGSRIEVNGRQERVSKIGPSPLPGDSRPCVYLQGS
jgi:hypothetical protein